MKHAYYEPEGDLLFLHKGFDRDEKFDGNEIVGDIALDMSTKGRVRGVEILNAHRFFSDLGVDIDGFEDGRFSSVHRADGTISLTLFLRVRGEEIPARIAVAV